MELLVGRSREGAAVNVDEAKRERAARGEENRLSTRTRSAHLRSPEAAELVCNSVSYQTRLAIGLSAGTTK